jgi:hypothetical protein
VGTAKENAQFLRALSEALIEWPELRRRAPARRSAGEWGNPCDYFRRLSAPASFFCFPRNPLGVLASGARTFARGANCSWAASYRVCFDRTANGETCRRENFLWKNV